MRYRLAWTFFRVCRLNIDLAGSVENWLAELKLGSRVFCIVICVFVGFLFFIFYLLILARDGSNVEIFDLLIINLDEL